MGSEIENMVESATDEAIGQDGGAPEVPDAGTDASASSEAPAESAAPVDAWKSPTREEWEAVQRYAEVGREFHPHAEKIRGAMARGFEPAPAQHTIPAPRLVAPPKLEEPDEYETLAGTKAAYDKWKVSANEDPREYARLVKAVANREFKDKFAKLDALLERFDNVVEPEIAESRGFRALADARFQVAPKWAQHGEAVTKLLQSGFRGKDAQDTLNRAFQIAEAEARKAATASGATPAQAAKAGAAAGAAAVNRVASAAANSPKAPAAMTRSAPRNEASLRPSAPRRAGTAPAKSPGYDAAKGGRYEKDLVSAALRQHGVQ